jgi:hypothetical protein
MLPTLPALPLLPSGIYLTMHPNYLPQTICYIVGTQWFFEPSVAPLSLPASGSLLYASLAVTTLWVFLTCCALCRVEYWPITGVPMYSFYRDHSFSYASLKDAEQAQHVAREFADSGYPDALAWSNMWISLRIKNTAVGAAAASDAVDEINVKSIVCAEDSKRGVLQKQFRRWLQNVAAQDMAEKPRACIGYAETKGAAGFPFPAQRWLRFMLPVLRGQIGGGARALPAWTETNASALQLCVKLAAGQAVIAELPWAPAAPRL